MGCIMYSLGSKKRQGKYTTLQSKAVRGDKQVCISLIHSHRHFNKRGEMAACVEVIKVLSCAC